MYEKPSIFTTAPDIKKRAVEYYSGPKSPPAFHTNWKFFD
jgi:hypothetical protein